MKKLLVFLGIIVAGVCTLYAGGANEGKTDASGPQVWKFSSGAAPSNAAAYAIQVFGDKVKERTQGRISVDFYASGQLGTDKECISLMQMGSLVGADINTSLLSAIDPAFMIMDLPYVTTSQKQLIDILNKGFGDYVSDRLIKAANLRITAWIVKGPRVVYNHRRPIYKLEDMKGMKLRIMENPVMARSLELLGAVPVPLPSTERVMAMQTGVVDGCENSLAVIWQEKEYEVVKYVSMTNHFNTPNVTVVDNRVIEALPADLKKVVLDAGKESGMIASDYDADINKQCETDLVKVGLKLNGVDNLQPFIDAVKPVIDEYAPQIGRESMDFFNKMKDQVK
jgi:tripartite ATP-independent transporter DctP family solute receptor